MNMVGHQAIRVQRAAPSPAELAEIGQVDEPVALVPEAVLSVIAALPYVHGNLGKNETRMPRHDGTTASAGSALTGPSYPQRIITTLAPN
jgi:hypothetical protein